MINLDSLNPKQLEAVTSMKNTMVVASAGTGKTRVLTYHLAYLLSKGIEPTNIYAFTFTNKAAREMKKRALNLNYKARQAYVSTFHSYFYDCLNTYAENIGFEYPISIIDDDDKINILRGIIKELNLELLDKDVKQIISNIKNFTNFDLPIKQNFEILQVFYIYQERLRRCNRMDFDDLQYYMYQLIISNVNIRCSLQEDFKYILIDESQDVNNIQFKIIDILGTHSKQIFIVGDQDQCIYSFRGSNLKNMDTFRLMHKAKVIILEENYRSTEAILKCANDVIKNNLNRIEKSLFTSNSVNDFKITYKPYRTSEDEARFASAVINLAIQNGYQYEDIAILYRNNRLSHPFEKQFIIDKIPFKVFGAYPFFKHKEIKSLLNVYTLINNPRDDVAFNLVCKYPKRFISEELLTKLINKQKKNRVSLYDNLMILYNEDEKDFLTIIRQLHQKFDELSPEEFFDLILETFEYKERITKEQKAQEKLNRIQEFKEYISSIPYGSDNKKRTMEFINNIYLDDSKGERSEGVKLMTIHQSKGLEFKIVILVDLNEGILPVDSRSINTIEEERRIFYVGITRAKERLFITSAERHFINGRTKYLAHSSFLKEITDI